MLKYSYKTYPRPHLFIGKDAWSKQKLTKITPSTVSEWVRNLIPSKNIGIDTFRSSFVSYYFPKFNYQQKSILKHRMRTSIDIIQRSYLKYYNNPDELVKVKLEPDLELVARTSAGTTKATGFIVGEDGNEIVGKSQRTSQIVPQQVSLPKVVLKTAHDRRKDNFNKWYDNPKNKENHLKKVREHSKSQDVYITRYLRELNNGKMEYSRLSNQTISKYGIKVKDGVYYAEKEK